MLEALKTTYLVAGLIATTLPSRQNDEVDVLGLLEERHRKRQAAIEASRARQQHDLLKSVRFSDRAY
jgi:hypothetical protein